MFKEFREFALKSNVVDLAIGVIIGGAFGKIVTSFVNDILMPPIGLLLGRVNFSDLFINLSDKPYATLAQAKAAGAPTLNYGLFINNVIDFVIVAAVIFFVIQQLINRLKKKPAPSDPATKECTHCFSSIHIRASRCPHCTSVLND